MSRRRLLLGFAAVAGGLIAAGLGPRAVAQLGGLGQGGLGPGGEFFQSLAGEELLQGGVIGDGQTAPTMFLLISPDKTRLWGYSTEKGEWKDSGFKGGDGAAVVPILGGSVAVFRTRDKAYAFGSESGEWDSVDLSGPGTPIVGTHVAAIGEGRKVHAFSSLKGEWDTLELPEGTNPVPVVGTDYAQVRTDKLVAVFSARTGTWAAVEFAEE